MSPEDSCPRLSEVLPEDSEVNERRKSWRACKRLHSCNIWAHCNHRAGLGRVVGLKRLPTKTHMLRVTDFMCSSSGRCVAAADRP